MVSGNPDSAKVYTSHIERVNLHVRMMSQRFTRLTTGFSKKREALKAAASVFVASYNLCWRHSALRMSPAMHAGLRAPNKTGCRPNGPVESCVGHAQQLGGASPLHSLMEAKC